jgi:hypothetical protein
MILRRTSFRSIDLIFRRIRSNNEKIIFRIGDPMLADPAGKVARSETTFGW